ncbi:uncharacterized protein LOC132702794 isoform X2 [Cylas formicarius]|uniref:uncharacterized protein LOC132702794 isoform X2 n=1 Tax=Cylas formicarius TaxID=197179 RepID=UPI0029588418|nr:uncharacterized protein LOC132702794 isoform X2 [Cylas formicarius]
MQASQRRIPTLLSRIPQISSKIPATHRAQIPATSHRLEAPSGVIATKHVGQKVLAGDQEGLLRYVGAVHFAKGTWCGIELFNNVGKNDGVVKGIRYFACGRSRGLMVPVAKVSLIEGSCESLGGDHASGPYSMLFLNSKIASSINLSRNASKKDNYEPVVERTKNLNEPTVPRRSFSAENLTETHHFIANSVADLRHQTQIRIEYGQQKQQKPKKRSNEIPLQYEDSTNVQSLEKSCKDLLTDSPKEMKQRRRSNPEKPLSLSHLKPFENFSVDTPPQKLLFTDCECSTPAITAFNETAIRKWRFSDITSPIMDNDSGSKRDSLDCDDHSLGILSSSQMVDFEKTKYEKLGEGELIKLMLASPKEPLRVDFAKLNDCKEEVQSPNQASITDFSLGIIDLNMLSTFTALQTDTTMNLELPLDSVDISMKELAAARCEQTPSPEELPLDTTPIVESEPKTEPTKSKTSSYITSITTSITSLDIGYQGDGEMSRPASRGADNSPLTKRPLPRPQPRRVEPMTDSDFYTESDADNHEENQHKGDSRKAQVIDGTLYGVDPQAAADIYVNNRENMDSSGIFTDIESGNKNEDDLDDAPGLIIGKSDNTDVSPTESSTKSISENSQNNVQALPKLSGSDTKKMDTSSKESNPKKRNAPSPGVSSPSSMSSPRHVNNVDGSAKKYKIPKRDVVSKVKVAMEQRSAIQNPEKKAIKKSAGRWDAVMNKISGNEQNKMNLKEVKSKVFNNINLGTPSGQKSNEVRKPGVRPSGSPNSKSRRIRTRTTPQKTTGNRESSIHSSLSDLSASTTLPKKIFGSAKKRDTIQVTQVLTPNKLSPRNHQNLNENKKNGNIIQGTASAVDVKTKKPIFSAKEKKPSNNVKECGKSTVKGGRTSPSVRSQPSQNNRATVKQQPPVPRVAEALAVLVQHLVFNVEAYQVPNLRRQVDKFRLEAEEVRLACQHLEEALSDEKSKNAATIEEERVRYRKDITGLIEKHRNQVAQLTFQHAEIEAQLRDEKGHANFLCRKHEEELDAVKLQLEKLQKFHHESIDILREENDSIRKQIDEERLEVEKVKHESAKWKHDYENKEVKLKGELESITEKIAALMEENRQLRDENEQLLNSSGCKGIKMEEMQSLRVVVELKREEVSNLRKTLGEVTHKLESLMGAEKRANALQARCEDLQHQLQRKTEYAQVLLEKQDKLEESFKEEANQKWRMIRYNEELQYKLKQNTEVMNIVMEQTGEYNRSNSYNSSFSEKHSATKSQFERTLSFRDRTLPYKSKNSIDLDTDDVSEPTSPTVKAIVEKSDSVSYVLDLDERPNVVASRIIRRSFRNATPPKNTPTKSPSNKRARIRNPLSLSASSGAIVTPSREENGRPRSASAREVDFGSNFAQSTPKDSVSNHSHANLHEFVDMDEDNEVDLELPALPSELDKKNGALALPSPEHLAGEGGTSDSNSEDESTSSSQL